MKINSYPKYDFHTRLISNRLYNKKYNLTDDQIADLLFKYLKNKIVYTPVKYQNMLFADLITNNYFVSYNLSLNDSTYITLKNNFPKNDQHFIPFFTDITLAEISSTFNWPSSIIENSFLMPAPSHAFLKRCLSQDLSPLIFNFLSKYSQICISKDILQKVSQLFSDYQSAMASPLVPAHLSKTCRAVPLSLSEILDDPCLLQTDQLSSIEELDPYPATVLIKDWASPNIEPKLSFRWATNQYRRKIVDNTYDYYPTSRIFHYVVTDLNAIKMPFVSSDSDLLDINYDELTSFVNQISYYFDIEYEEQKLATSKIQEVLEEIFEINSVKLQETLSNTAKSNDFNSSNDDVLIETESISDTNNISQTDNDLFTDSTINSDSDETVEDLQNNKKFIHIKTFNDLKHKYIKKSIQWSVFKSKLYKLRMKYRKLEQSIQHLENQNQGLQERFKSAVAERKQHQEARQKTQDQLTETNLKKNELEAKLPTLQEALREKDVELEILNEKNREISNSLKKTQTMLEDLSRSPDEVILENVELKQKYDESQNKLHELQALLSGKTIALNEANQSLQDSFREISILKNDLANAGEWIIPESLYDVVKAGKKYYSSKLVFHERIPSTIQAFTAGESDKKNRIVQEAVKMIKALADEMYNLKFVENNLSEQGFTDLTGIQFAMTERKITTRNKFFERMRTCKYMGQIIMFFPHLKSSIQGTEFRIHFQFLENEKKILICHIGGHIPTAGTRLNT